MLEDGGLLRGEGLKVVRSHHERWDGRGYPDGLAGTEIPIGARIFAVADALDAMTNNRPYGTARSWTDAPGSQSDVGGRRAAAPDDQLASYLVAAACAFTSPAPKKLLLPLPPEQT
jgi:hypothetical protein